MNTLKVNVKSWCNKIGEEFSVSIIIQVKETKLFILLSLKNEGSVT